MRSRVGTHNIESAVERRVPIRDKDEGDNTVNKIGIHYNIYIIL